jgi:hypothetical protein
MESALQKGEFFSFPHGESFSLRKKVPASSEEICRAVTDLRSFPGTFIFPGKERVFGWL